MKKVIVTLRDAPNASVEVPENFPRPKRAKKTKPRKIERSVFGAIRLFPGVPKAISVDELEYVKLRRPDVAARLDERPYVESKRVDYRGITEAAIEKLAEEEGIGHLDLARKVKVLAERKKIAIPDSKKSTATKIPSSTKKVDGGSSDGGKTTSRKPK